MIFPHTYTPEEKVFFSRRKAMNVPLQMGMHVLDALYPHRNESGGHACDSIITGVYVHDDYVGVGTITTDYTCISGSSANYFVPKLEHFETFLMCMREAKNRKIETLFIPDFNDSPFHKAGFKDAKVGEIKIDEA